MMTMEQIQNEKQRLFALEKKLNELKKMDAVVKSIETGENRSCVSVSRVMDSAELGIPVNLSLMLTDAENSVLLKSVLVVLEFAKNRIEKEMEEMQK